MFIAFVFVFSGCRKDKEQEPASETNSAYLKFYHYSGGSSFAFNTNYLDGSGNVYQFTMARMYMSDVSLRDMGGSVMTNYNTYLIISPDSTDAVRLGGVTDGHVHTIDFNVGVDSVTNHSDPSPWPADHPLAPQSPSMHWGWSMGYIFFMLEGVVDTDGNGTPDSPFQFHVGTDSFLRNSGDIMMHTDISGDVTFEVDIDWANFFSGIDLSVDNMTHTSDNLPLATTAADNVPLLFSAH